MVQVIRLYLHRSCIGSEEGNVLILSSGGDHFILGECTFALLLSGVGRGICCPICELVALHNHPAPPRLNRGGRGGYKTLPTSAVPAGNNVGGDFPIRIVVREKKRDYVGKIPKLRGRV